MIMSEARVATATQQLFFVFFAAALLPSFLCICIYIIQKEQGQGGAYIHIRQNKRM
jgi:NADH:ubiquinone oxidoreductase subunit 4 (subunit M)